MNAKIKFGIMCAFGAMTPVAFATPATAEDTACPSAVVDEALLKKPVWL
jgi:hypothetical protein